METRRSKQLQRDGISRIGAGERGYVAKNPCSRCIEVELHIVA